MNPFSKPCFCLILNHCGTEPFKDMVVGNIQGGRKYIFFKCFAFCRKDICVLSQNQLSSDKLFLFTSQLAVVHTAPYVHNGAVHRVLL